MYLTTTPASETALACFGPATAGAANRGWAIEVHNGTSTGIWFYQSGVVTSYTSLGSLPSANTWAHIAIVRNSTVVTGYINGVSGGTTSVGTSTQTAFNAGDIPLIGAYYISTGNNTRFYFPGYKIGRAHV